MGTTIIIWLCLCGLVAYFASTKGRSAPLIFLFSLVLSPVIGLIVTLFLKTDKKEIGGKEIASGHKKRCRKCAELIKKEASGCRFCGKKCK